VAATTREVGADPETLVAAGRPTIFFRNYEASRAAGIGMLDRATADVTPRLSTSVSQTLEPGTRVLFTGVARDFGPGRLWLLSTRPNVTFLPPKVLANAGA